MDTAPLFDQSLQHTLADDSKSSTGATLPKNEDEDNLRKTPMGVVPSDWTLMKIREMGEVVTGTTPPTKDEDNYGGEHLFVTPGDLSGKYVGTTERALSDKGLSNARPVPSGSIFFTCIGSTIGKASIATERSASNQQINAIVPNDESHGEYFFYALRFNAERIKLQAGTQAVPMINKSDFSSIRLPTPPQEERHRIAGVLSTWDRALQQIDDLIGAKERRKKALMQQLLTGQTRLPGFGGKVWETRRLRDLISSLDAGVSVNSEDRPIGSDEIGILKTSAVTYGVFNPEEHKAILRSEYDRAKLNPQRDSIIISRMNTSEFVGASVYVGDDYPDLFLPDRLWQATLENDVSAQWLNYALGFGRLRSKISNASTGTSGSMKNISQRRFLSLKTEVPPLREQQAIANILSTCDAELELLRTERQALQKQKKGMMQKLLTGAVRVPADHSVDTVSKHETDHQTSTAYRPRN